MKRLLIILLLLFAAACQPAATLKTGSFSAELETSESVDVTISMPGKSGTLNTLPPNSDTLFSADVEYIGQMTFNVSGDEQKTLLLSEDMENLTYEGDETLDWDIEVTQRIPVELTLDINAGDFTANLNPLTVPRLIIDSNAANLDINAPQTVESATITSNAGAVNITIPDDAVFGLERIDANAANVMLDIGANVGFDGEVDGNAAEITLRVPAGTGVLLNVNALTAASITVPDGYTRPSGDSTGAYESDNYSDAETQITLSVDLSAGQLIVEEK